MEEKTNQRDCSDMPLAMAYVPWQKWREVYSPELGFQRGTIFAELDKPWIGEEAIRND